MTPKEKKLSHARLFSLLDYNPDTGVFVWKVARGIHGLTPAGRTAGCPNNKGYLRVVIDGSHYVLHRLAWFYMTKGWPAQLIDHIDGNPANNRFSNLREATPAQNQMNRRSAYNKTGIHGVSFHAASKKYVAQISSGGRKYYLGIFADPAEAKTTYQMNAAVLQKEFAYDRASNTGAQ